MLMAERPNLAQANCSNRMKSGRSGESRRTNRKSAWTRSIPFGRLNPETSTGMKSCSFMKRMTSWGAILLGSTLVTGIYGMNFVHMPELEWKWGFWWALAIMAFITIAGYLWFKTRDWL